jgi:hypothetical protein
MHRGGGWAARASVHPPWARGCWSLAESVSREKSRMPYVIHCEYLIFTGAYRAVVSPRLGRSSQKEQYAIFYKAARVQLLVRFSLLLVHISQSLM